MTKTVSKSSVAADVISESPMPAIDPRPNLPTSPTERAREAVNRALGFHRAGRMAEAVAAYDEAVTLAPAHPDAWVNRGVALRRMGHRDQALASYWRALETDADRAALWGNIANCLLDMSRRDEAQAAVHNAMAVNPMVAEHWRILASLMLLKGQSCLGEAALRRAIALAPDDAPTLVRLGSLMNQQGDYDLAMEIIDRALALAPLLADAHSAKGQIRISQGRLAEAEPCLRRALELDSEHLDARLGLARKLLLEGALQTGWVEYEWRRRKPESKINKLPGVEWNGEPLTGKTLLVHSEQGFGDLLHFVRYLPILARQGARIILAVPQVLVRVMTTVEGVAKVVTNLNNGEPFDFHVPLLTIPRIVGVALDRIPNKVPYLKAPEGPRLPAPAGTRLKIGIVWAGSPKHANDRNRSLTLESLLPLAAIHGVTLYSLQTGPHAGDIGKEAHGALVRDLSGHLRDFADTANVIAQLDLVVCVDTSVAHLAGAMGKPVWVLTPFAPDWRWILGRDDCPWYPSMRLYRQTTPKLWDDVIARVVQDVSTVAQSRPDPSQTGETVVHSMFAAADGGPRFRMWVPRPYLTDPGLRFLVRTERWDGGYEYATRSFIDAHLQPGDLFIDVGAHWGIMALQAATRWPGQVQVLACEPADRNQTQLRRWIDGNGLSNAIEMVSAAVADAPGKGVLRPESTMGHSLVRQEDGEVTVVTIDGLLAERPALAGRRVIIKIDVEGGEPLVIEGMRQLLASGRVAAVIWEKGIDYDGADGPGRIEALRARMAEFGFIAWRFKTEEEAGAMTPFVNDGWHGNVFELAPGVALQPAYGQTRPAPMAQPADEFLEAGRSATDLVHKGGLLQSKGKVEEALRLYDQAAQQDMRQSDLFNNVGVALRGMGRLQAAEACYRRAIALAPRHAGCISNLGNVLREMGCHDEAAQMQLRALSIQPHNPKLYYNAGLVARDNGRPADARALFEKVLQMEPDNSECRWDLALSLLQSGDYKRGLPAYESRWDLARSQPKLLSLPRWDGRKIKGKDKTLFLHDEQGFGDVLMFARFIPEAKRRGFKRIILQCQPQLMRLMAMAPGVDAVIPRGEEPPAECDLFAPLLSLAGMFGYSLDSIPKTVPYLNAPEPLQPLPEDKRLRAGLVWAGKPTPRDRSYPLDKLIPALGDPRWSLFSLQMGPRIADLTKLGGESMITDLSPQLVDFAETAAILKKLDLLITCDTSIAHLAGALGVPTFVPLLYTSDWRWFDEGMESPWYPSMTLFRQPVPGDWDSPMRALSQALKDFADHRRDPLPGLTRLP